MSHELRSPLSAMLGFTQLIEAGTPAPTPAQHDSVQQILHAGWYLLGLINEILDLTAIESGQLVLRSQAVSLNEVLDDCRAMIEPQAQGAGIDLRFPRLEQPCLVQADATRTKQVLLNLLTNAIKYNRSAGRVDVRCTAVPGQRVRVSVEDTGPGLSMAQTAQLFEPFNRLGQESGTEPGTGIGLVICKRLIELMDGRIGVDSRVGAGSCFWFELGAASTLPARGLPVHTVLCIEHDPTRLQPIEELVARRPGVCLLRARDIRGGIEIARSARPDAILLRVTLLDSSAVQAMLLLAKDPATAHIPVIALGADTVPHDVEAHLAAGCFDDLTQPVQREALGHALDLAFQRTHSSGLRAAAQETH
jgi:CheY-like chemotaxis protein/two-component sensor histidine kinase